jgi:hypothetical protein
MALKKAASIVVPETVVDEVGDAIITAIRDPKSAAENAIMTRSRARKAARAAAPEPEEEVTPIIPPMTGRISKRRGGKKTKKRVTKKRKTTRRSAFSY